MGDSHHIPYLAGLIDGEGCVSVDRTSGRRNRPGFYYWAQVRVAMTDKRPLYLLGSLYGGSISSTDRSAHGHKRLYTWTLGGGKVTPLLKDIEPYCIVKKAQVAMALEFLETRGELTEDECDLYWSAFRLLNRRGIDEHNEARKNVTELYS